MRDDILACSNSACVIKLQCGRRKMDPQGEPRRLFQPETETVTKMLTCTININQQSPSSRDLSPDREASPEVEAVY